MQGILRLGWSDILGDNKSDSMQFQKMRPAPMMDMSIFNKLKRKRTDSPEPVRSSGDLDCKRKKVLDGTDRMSQNEGRREAGADNENIGSEAPMAPAQAVDSFVHPAPHSPSFISPEGPGEAQRCCMSGQSSSIHTMPYSQLDTAADQSPLQQIIEQQFNTEILVKHRELRLIEQELAKCQVALEQLRRCELLQYPGAASLSSDVTCGSGPALQPNTGFTQPIASAPWGVADGPYTRHYSKWLIPDPAFDSVPIAQAMSSQDVFARPDNRLMRTNIPGVTKVVKSRANRDSINSLHGLGTGLTTAAPRNKGGPLVIKRLGDKTFVKLVCKECHRGDFSSVQGFLNHCRIAHKLDYKSHEAAAQDCGRLLEPHEQNLAATAPPPVGSTTRSSVPKPSVPLPVSTRVHSLNHPTIHSGPPRPTWKIYRVLADLAKAPALCPGRKTLSSNSFHASPFVPSASMPFLSAQFAKRGLGGDLEKASMQAKEKVDLGIDEVGEEVDDISTTQSPVARPGMASRTVSGSIRAIGTQRPASGKGHRPRPAPLASASLLAHSSQSEIPESPMDTELSPHTADSDPGLVSDHEDDSISEPEEDANSVVTSPVPLDITQRECGDAMEVDAELESLKAAMAAKIS